MSDDPARCMAAFPSNSSKDLGTPLTFTATGWQWNK